MEERGRERREMDCKFTAYLNTRTRNFVRKISGSYLLIVKR
jgi:hypothetical protein